MNQRKPQPGPAVGRERPERARLLALPGAAAPGRLPALPRPHEPGQGRAPRDRGRDGAGLPLKLAGKMPRAGRARSTSTSSSQPHLRPTRSSTSARSTHGEKVELLAGRARDAVPDRVGGAVRPRDDRVDGVRHAGDRDALGRGARGDRGRPQRDHRRRLPRHGRRARRGRRARAARAAPLRGGALLAASGWSATTCARSKSAIASAAGHFGGGQACHRSGCIQRAEARPVALAYGLPV